MMNQILKSGGKDPRAWLGGTQPYSPSYQADRQQTYDNFAQEYGNTVPMSEALAELNVSANFNPQLDYTRYIVDHPFAPVASATFTPLLLIPRNTARLDLIIVNLSIFFTFFPPVSHPFAMNFTFGPTPIANLAGSAAINQIGVPIAGNAYYQPRNGVVPINDIFVAHFGPTLPPIGTIARFLGFEGTAKIGSS